ncbi:hypothetical protein CRG98_042464 [Punica granatum]|uniref:Uncharacterized protein n=1 Tax=Punica granatum TaxID=22663 RepID=A0A2I0HZJ2_PUNGR|nr:hypothetical protein CRG98_042464 [Punica granatum]
MVATIYRNGGWHWPRSSDPQSLMVQNLALQLSFVEADKVVWKASKAGRWRAGSEDDQSRNGAFMGRMFHFMTVDREGMKKEDAHGNDN